MTAKNDSSLPKVTIEKLKEGSRFRRLGRRRTFIKKNDFGIPKPVQRPDGGIDYISTCCVKTLSGRTFDLPYSTEVIPVTP